MTFKRLLGLAMAMVAAAVLVGSVGAGAARTPAKPAVDLSTNAKVREYLRSLGISPRGVVIQRGARNYAGPRCPGKRWKCTRSHRVVQIANHRGKNSFRCLLARCVVVQVTKSLLAKNNATCIRATGITQSCAITQSGTGPNTAGVYMSAVKNLSGSGLTQNASQTATITQTATAQSAGATQNTACVAQITDIQSTTRAKGGVPVTATFDAHQSIRIVQDAHAGGNLVQKASSSGGCLSGDLEQTQTLSSTATGSGSITQNENKTIAGRNMLIDIAQNQSDTYFGSATGPNTAAFSQTSTLTALATTLNGPVNQWQSRPESDGGGVDAIVNQDSRDKSTASATQTEIQCARAVTSGTPRCDQQSVLPQGWTQTQYGPVRKGGHGKANRHFMLRKGSSPSNQTGSADSRFFIDQKSTQDVDAGNPDQITQENFVQAECSTPGNCRARQQTDINGEQSPLSESNGTNVSATINCSGSSCVGFDGSPGTNAPPATLGGYTMTPFGPDPQADGAIVSGVNDPAGSIAFSPSLTHTTVGSLWSTWSHGYTGDVYFVAPTQPITITLPAGTKAFYLYAEPNTFDVFDVQATAQDGTTSGPVQVQGNSGAKYFGFYGTGDAEVATITVTTADTSGLAVGEFGIFVPVIP